MLYIFIIALLAIVTDQTVKILVMNLIEEGEEIWLINGLFYLTHEKNSGVAWSFEFVPNNPTMNLIIQLLIAAVALTVFIYLAIKIKDFKSNRWYGFTIGLLIGGLIGNVIDRIFYPTHSVTDMIGVMLPYFTKYGLEWYRFPIFNIADSCLVIGVIMLLIYLIFIEPKKEKMEEKAEDEVINVTGKTEEKTEENGTDI